MNKRNKKKILVICPHPENMVPGQRLKYEQYFDHWRENGYDVKVSSFASRRFQEIMYNKGHVAEKVLWTILGYLRRVRDIFRLPFFDVIYIFLYVTPVGFPLMERIFRFVNPKIVYDIDDAIFAEYKSVMNSWSDRIKGKAKPFYLMKVAKEIITCTPYLTEKALKFNTHTTDISSTINTEKYIPKTNYCFNEDKPVLGWSGSHSTVWHLQTIFPVLRKLKSTFDFRLVAMGTDHLTDDILEIEAIPWKEEHEVSVISRFDIGIYPLPDKEFVLGKSGLKAIQYMSLGIPTVATAIGTNFRVIDSGTNGFLAGSEEDWILHLSSLLQDLSLREQIGCEAVQKVEKYFSIHANRPVYLQILDSVSGRKS